MKRLLSACTAIALLASVLSGCGSGKSESGADGGADDGQKIKLTVATSSGNKQFNDGYQQVVDQFEKENPNIEVELQFPGGEYENLMKVKMASSDMPDIFDTHGWAKLRYGDYAADLRDEPWVSQMDDSLKPYLTDESGKVYALPLIASRSGIRYNVDLLKKYGIEVPRTMDELEAAGEKILKESKGEVVPFYLSGLEAWTVGFFFMRFANPLLVSPKDNFVEELKNKTFDFANFTYLPKKFKEWYDKGLINEDVLTAKYSDIPQLLADGKITFAMYNDPWAQALQINPDLKMGLMPIPAVYPDDEPGFQGGESYTMAVWKDSKHIDAAKKLVSYFAKPEHAKLFAEAAKQPPGLKGVEADLGTLTPYYKQYASLRVFPSIDIAYWPSGTFDFISTLGQEVIAGTVTPEQFSERLGKEVERLRSSQQ